MKNKLLEKAKSMKAPITRNTVGSDLIELSIAWAKDEISLSQAQYAITGSKQGMTAYVGLARGLRGAVRTGKLIIKK